jgi:ABC-type lipoprotein export system ATPase subunit
VRVFGRSTAEIVSAEAWLASLDRLGLMTGRAVFIEGMSVLQNLALPFGLDIDPPAPELAAQARALARDVSIPESALPVTMSAAPPGLRARVQFARALALGPEVLLLEHPTLDLPVGDSGFFGADVARVADRRRLTLLALTDDAAFAERAASRRLLVKPGTGAVTRIDSPGWWRR